MIHPACDINTAHVIIWHCDMRQLSEIVGHISAASVHRFTLRQSSEPPLLRHLSRHHITHSALLKSRVATNNVWIYRKSTDRNMYLLTSSCHPNSVTKNIPFSLALRIVRICSETETRDQRLSELREMLLNRDYRPGIVDAAINKAKAIPRSEALKRVVRPKTSERPVFVVKYDPRLPSVTQIVQKHWRSMVTNPQMAEVFPAPPLIAYTRPKTLKDHLIRAKVPSSKRPKRMIPGMHKCGKFSCRICPYVSTGKIIKAKYTNAVVQLSKSFDCQTTNVVYIVTCKKCKDQYIGQTKKHLKIDLNNILAMWQTTHKLQALILIYQPTIYLTWLFQYLKKLTELTKLWGNKEKVTLLSSSISNTRAWTRRAEMTICKVQLKNFSTQAKHVRIDMSLTIQNW